MNKERKKSNYINFGTDEQMEIWGYRQSMPLTIIIWIIIILTVGILRLIFYWKPDWMLKSTHLKCNLNNATKVLLKDKYDQLFVENVKILDNYKKDIQYLKLFKQKRKYDSCHETNFTLVRYITNKRWKYLWNEVTEIFERLKGDEENIQIEHFHLIRGLNEEEQNNKRLLYGKNSIRIHLTRIYVLLFREIFSPFYIFQVVSCILWFNDSYYYYASCIIILSALSTTYTLYSIRRNERALRDMIHRDSKVKVFRYKANGQLIEEEISSENLVPGDIIKIENMTVMQCDAVLLNGNVIVNESMLTGESVPVTKLPVMQTNSTIDYENLNKENLINIKEHNKHILFGGTQVIQIRTFGNENIKAVVLKTGFNTTKGELVRSILHPKPVDFRFNNDTYKYVGALGILALMGMVIAIVFKTMKNNPVEDIVKRSLDIITIAVPPALPGALAAGLVYAQNRLKSRQIYCISPRTINISGTLDTFVFDKTGTLTEDGLDLKCIMPIKRSNNNDNTYFDKELENIKDFRDDYRDLLESMASCHSITRINGELAGDPLDCKMFEFTNWDLIEPTTEESKLFNMLVPTIVLPKNSNKNDTPYQIGIIRQFPFSSSLQRMSVIVRALNRVNFDVYCKGSPEKIAELSKPESLPNDFQQILSLYTKEGYRVIAIAKKQLDINYSNVQRIERDKVESDLEFLGLIIMENRLKPETTPTINRLKAANIRTIMCTGDNILTALSVARECNLINQNEKVIIVDALPGVPPKFSYAEVVKKKVQEIEFDNNSNLVKEKNNKGHYHFAITGKSFEIVRNEHKELFEKLVVRGTVFGRMSPDQKQQLVEKLQELGYFVGMCGDGANDCGALKAANAGISLSSAEASVASPFTSKNPNIECVPLVIREGRAALVTSFGVVKFIVMYSVTQFLSVLILYSINAGLTDFEFLYIDLILMTLNAFFFSRTDAYPELNKKPPFNKLIAIRPILSLLTHTVLILGFQLFMFFYVKWQPWFESYEDSDDKEEKNFSSYENTVIFCLSMFQYLSQAIIFSKGPPYRLTMFSNPLFLCSMTATLIFSLILNLAPIVPLLDFFTMRMIPDLKFRVIILAISILYFFIAFLFESYIIENNSSFEPNDDYNNVDDKKKKKCCPNRNQIQHHKIEREIRRDRHWPPIHKDEVNDHGVINLSFQEEERISRNN